VFSPDGRVLAQAGDTVTRLWDLRDPRRPRLATRIPAGPDNYMVFAPAGRRLAVLQAGGLVVLWNVTDPGHPLLLSTLRGNPPLADAIAFSPDGRTVAVQAGDDTADLWDLTDPLHPAPTATLTGVHKVLGFQPDGHTLTVLGTDGTPRQRETDGTRAAATLCTHVPALGETAWQRYFTGIDYRPACP
jgi:WD40 repeat protein